MIKICLYQLFFINYMSDFSLFSSIILWERCQVSHFPIARGALPHLLVDVAAGQSQLPWLPSLPSSTCMGCRAPQSWSWSDSHLLHTESSQLEFTPYSLWKIHRNQWIHCNPVGNTCVNWSQLIHVQIGACPQMCEVKWLNIQSCEIKHGQV